MKILIDDLGYQGGDLRSLLPDRFKDAKMTETKTTMNAQRAEWAQRALATLVPEPTETTLVDLLANLMHWAHQNNCDFTEALHEARVVFNMERKK